MCSKKDYCVSLSVSMETVDKLWLLAGPLCEVQPNCSPRALAMLLYMGVCWVSVADFFE